MSSEDISSSDTESEQYSSDLETVPDEYQKELDRKLLTEDKYWDIWTIMSFPAHGETTGFEMADIVRGFYNTNFKRRNRYNIELHDLEPMTRVMSRLVHDRVSKIHARKDDRIPDLKANPAVGHWRDVWHPTIFMVSRQQAIGLGVRFQWGKAPILAEWAEGIHFAFFVTDKFMATCCDLLKPADRPDIPEVGSEDMHIIHESECGEMVDHMNVKHQGLEWWIRFLGYRHENKAKRIFIIAKEDMGRDSYPEREEMPDNDDLEDFYTNIEDIFF